MKNFRLMICCVCGTIAFLMMAADSIALQDQEKVETTTYWIFLTTGKPVTGVPAEEVNQMQQAHLQNFGRLAQAGHLATAGPMSDPDQTLRGIVVINAKDEKALAEMFEPDPYVGRGFLQVEPHAVDLRLGRFTSEINTQELEELRIAIISAGESESAWLSPEEIKWLQDAKTELVIVGAFKAAGPRRGILIFRNTDDAQLKQQLDSLGSFSRGELKYRLMPQYLGKGSIVENAPSR